MLTPLRLFFARLRALVTAAEDDREFAQELQAHLELLTDDNVGAGMTPDEARRQARLTLGMASSLQSQHRDVRGFRVLEDLFQDVRFAFRLMRKERWFTAAAVTAIALGIGANTVGFSIIDAAFFRGFNFERAEELHAISWRPTRGLRLQSSPLDLDDWRTASSFSGVAAAGFGAINISDDHAAPEQTQGAQVTVNLFDVLRQPPLLGRTFVTGEDRRGAAPVVIIGYDLWMSRFAGDPNVLGRTLRINSKPTTIVGVMPQGMKFPDNSELWSPYIPTDVQLSRDVRPLSVFARLKPGVTRADAATELEAIAQRIIADHPNQRKAVTGAKLETLVERFLNGAAPRMFVVIMGAVCFVLLIACANVANLLLSRVVYRSREVAVRYALGATRWRVMRQLLIESIALSGLGAIVGVSLARVGVQAFDSAIQASGAPYWLRFTVDYRVLFYVAATCIVTGIIFGLAPALQVSRANPQDTLKEGARGAAGNRRAGRAGGVMVVAELAMTIVLLCGAGLMLRSFVALYAAPPGFDINGLTRMQLQLPPARYPDVESRRRFYAQLLPKIDAIPGLQSATVTTAVPPLRHETWRVIIDRSAQVDDDERPFVSTVSVAPRFFETLGVGVARGRVIEASDGASGAANVVINQRMADEFFPGEDPVGRRLRFVPRSTEPDAQPQPWRTVVGIVPTFQQGTDDEAFHNSIVYLPFLNLPERTASLMVRSAMPPDQVMTAVRSVVQSLDADQPVFNIETIQHVFENERSIYRIFAWLFGLLAAIGLTLSAVGIYGVIAYAVTQRTQEIGVRVAIGASRWDVAWLFLRRGVVQLGLALAIGMPAALALGAVARIPVVEVHAGDPVTMVGIAIVISAVALAACLIPARKASRIDPVVALRAE